MPTHEISFSLPKTPYTTAHAQVTVFPKCALVFLATTAPGDTAVKPMGSFVYSMPDKNFSSTTMYSSNSVEYATRVSKILARRTGLPVYVGCSIDSASLGMTVEEEMEGLRRVVEECTSLIQENRVEKKG
ncbi:hypothetical protein ASPZODRAFT_128686 [Penicilliopsis zonata CBS 506.65]|uniref:Proteasome assembly chaperone 4 n=1 Tax=Penicilliopsis zonata CBS 506.65 TaxID=1073090 RepID=A0A1L9SSI7_9EURO|nr:hypothetical protein ASPZODRAFT_128686 [Penicilliopsis zonata CBS 506.65]OJJ50076.1 hypothetical protein ASPZODRAFT_128686 [Penicilliopsis zonata CBS 506.65]